MMWYKFKTVSVNLSLVVIESFASWEVLILTLIGRTSGMTTATVLHVDLEVEVFFLVDDVTSIAQPIN